MHLICSSDHIPLKFAGALDGALERGNERRDNSTVMALPANLSAYLPTKTHMT